MESRKTFYHLQYPTPTNPHQVYGRPEWERRFGTAEWIEKSAGFSTGRLLPPYGQPRKDLTIILPSVRVGDFVWTWYSDCIVTDRTLTLFKQAGFTGFESRPVTVEKIKRLSRKRTDEVIIPRLWELPIIGKGGEAAPESGIYPLYEIEDCYMKRFQYSSFRNGIIVDEANWDGSDFFTINGYPNFILASERVKELITDHQLTNCALIPSHKLEWGSGITPEESHAQTLELAGRPLESLLADLENPELIKDAIDGLGYKGDPRAVDPLISKFDDPDHDIWTSAASAVAAIIRHKENPEHVREQIFSKLCALLAHDNSRVHRSAATALCNINTDGAAEQVTKLLDDPDEWVRYTAVFELGVRHYRPALEAVRRLTKDSSQRVRKTARTMVERLECDFP